MNSKVSTPQSIQLKALQQPNVLQTQRLIMSAQMQQALHLLQIPLVELESYLEEQVVQNPLLELENQSDDDLENENTLEILNDYENDLDSNEEKELVLSDQDLSILTKLEQDWQDHFSQNESQSLSKSDKNKLHSYIEQSICTELSLHDQLRIESQQVFQQPEELKIAEILIGYIDQCGFLKQSISEIAQFHKIDEYKTHKILKIIQTFEPCGVGASSIQESLLIQLRSLQKEGSLAYDIVLNHYDELLHNQIPSIQKALKCSFEELKEAIEQVIAKLDLHPGTQFSRSSSQVIIPDVTLRQEDENLIVDVERDFIPSLQLNHRYLKMLENESLPIETRNFIKRHIFSARWLMRNLQQRYTTIERIAQSLVKRQYAFFMNPEGQLVPLTMKTVADELSLHESTIARTVSNKHLYCPRGLFPLRSFFTNKYENDDGEDISSTTVKDVLFEMIQKEDKHHPLSDEKLSVLLKEKGIHCARRTVAKYRGILKIGNAHQRRKFT
ncbi:MAG: RNA polymerase factor sigma-54 [Parachlamydiaceae bacterium]|nr:RNA polymerase factor sigma-54 [Parachlamydiaceae bacterium]